MTGSSETAPSEGVAGGLDALLHDMQRPGFGLSHPRYEVRQGFQTTPVIPLAMLDPEGWVVSVNSAWSTFARMNPAALLMQPAIGTNYLDACQETADGGDETTREALVGIGTVLAGSQRLFTMEYELKGADGQPPQWFAVEVTPLEGPRGGIVITHQDVTERRMFEQVVAHFALRYWTVSEQASDYAYEIRLDAAGRLTLEWVTEAFARVTGYTLEELGSHAAFRRLFHPSDRETVERHLSHLLDGDTHTATFRIVTRAGEVRWLRNHARPVWDGWAGRVVAIEGAAQDITEQKAAEEDLERNRLRLQALFDHALDAILLADDAGRLVDANPAACTLTGYSRAELAGLHLWDVAHADDETVTRTRWADLLSAGQQHGEFEIRRKDGRVVATEYRAVAHILPGLHLAVWRDITARRRADEALRESEAFLQSVVENLPSGVFVKDARDLRFVRVNQAVQDLLGRPVGELIGKTDAELFRTEEAAFILKQDREALERRRLVDVPEEQIYTRHHGIRTFHTKKIPILDAAGEPRYLLGISEDITAHKFAEQALRESEERWRMLVDNHPEPILVSIKGRIVFINRAGAELSGHLTQEPLIGRTLFDFLSAEQIDPFDERCRAIERGQLLPSSEYILIRLDGQERHVEAISVPVTYNGCRAIQTVLRDVTERKKFEQGLIAARDEAERVARLRTTILSNMSHEIRTPLTTVLGFAEVLVEELEGEHRELAALIERGGRRLSHTLNAVLDLARLDAGSLLIHAEQIDVVAKAREAAAAFRPFLDGLPVTLQVVAPEEPLRATLDVGVLSRILTHLLSNAVKFTERGTITLWLDAPDDRVRLRVQDTGVGISPEFMARIFEEFEQESTGLARSYEGSGLGLTITKRLVDLVGGTIDVESVKGRGSTFTVHLPRFMAHGARSAA